MMSVLSGEKKEKRRASLKSAIGKIPFRRKRASSSGLLPPEAQITVAKGEQGEEKVYVESSKPKEPQPPTTDNSTPNEESSNSNSSVMKLEVPVFDSESLQRSLVNPELVKMRESHRLERNRHVAFQDASMSRLRFRQQATVADRLAENKRLEDEKREKVVRTTPPTLIFTVDTDSFLERRQRNSNGRTPTRRGNGTATEIRTS